ncbi:unnamed protein product [Moneuplotes crassus]|uniref:Uncharacterized protein n=1 Tax=Euplotes crassus TaxID=5936 RepID=A0AAD1XN69_EUPCR|nr:unnamed protein product [Moneuplotes crassus]
MDFSLEVISRKLSVKNPKKTHKKEIPRPITIQNDHSNTCDNVALPTQNSKDSSRIDISNHKPQKPLETNTKNMCIEAQDFEDVYESSYIDQLHNLNQNPRTMKNAHTSINDCEKKSFSDKRTPQSPYDRTDRTDSFDITSQSQGRNRAKEGQEGILIQTANFEQNKLDTESKTSNENPRLISKELKGIKSIEMKYLYDMLTTDAPINKSIIIRHHNGDLCNNIKKCVRIERNSVTISKECAYKNQTVESKQLGINGRYIKWLKNKKQNMASDNTSAFISFPKKNMYQPTFRSSNAENRENDMIYIEANETFNQYTSRPTRKDKVEQHRKELNQTDPIEHGDTSSENSHKNFAPNSLSQPRYSKISQNITVEEYKTKYKQKYSSEYELDDSEDMIQVKDPDSDVKKVFTGDKLSLGTEGMKNYLNFTLMKTPPGKWGRKTSQGKSSNHNRTECGFYKSPVYSSTKVGKHKRALSLTGNPLDPKILKYRELKLLQEEQSKKENKSFFSKISKQFSEASKLHFGDNPGRRINTSHLRLQARRPMSNETAFSQIIDQKIDLFNLNNGDASNLLNKTVRLDNKNLFGIINRINPQSEVLSFPKNLKEPYKLLQCSQLIRGNRSSSFKRNMIQKESIKSFKNFASKPIYRPSGKDFKVKSQLPQSFQLNSPKTPNNYNQRFGNQKVKPKKESLLPFSALDIDPRTKIVNQKRLSTAKRMKRDPSGEIKKGQNEANIDDEDAPSFLTFKASTFRPLTSEPFHKKHVKMTRRGVPIYKFSATKPSNDCNPCDSKNMENSVMTPKNLLHAAYGNQS